MGAQWKQAGRESNANKRGQIIGELVKEMQVAAKLGGPEMDNNPRLRAAVESARRHSVPRDTIERAVKKGAGIGEDAVNYETIVYEGFAPHKVPIVVECLTDNKNRTAADVRVLFRKGQLGAAGAVAWMFERMGVVEATHTDKTLDIEGVAIEAGAQNVEPLEAADVPAGHLGARFFCETTDLGAVSRFLGDNHWSITLSEMNYIPKNNVELGEFEKKEVSDFLTAIDDNDDVHRVYAALR